MPINKQLFDYIQDVKQQVLTDEQETEVQNALDALLAAPTTEDDFNKAFKAHQKIWSSAAKLNWAEGNGLVYQAEGISLMEIKQKSAEQRVLLGLRDASDDILVTILANNKEACRAYIVQQAQLGNIAGKAGLLSTAAPELQNLLTDDSLKIIREQAVQLALLKLINTASLSYELLKPLLEAENKAALKAAIDKLDGASTVKFNISPDDLPESLNDVILRRIVMRSIETVPETSYKLLQSLADVTATDDVPVLTGLKERLNQLKIAPNDWIVEQDVTLIQTLAKKRMAAIRDEKLPEGQEQISKSDDERYLNKLIDATKLDDFRKHMGTPSDWVYDSQMKVLQGAAYSRLLELRVEKFTAFGVEAHPVLLATLKNLPTSKKNELRNDNKALAHVLNATDPAVIQHYLGNSGVDANALIAENNRIAGFKKIHNAVLAGLLARSQDPLITLNKDKITEINKMLSSLKKEDFDSRNAPIKALVGQIADNATSEQREALVNTICNNKDSIVEDLERKQALFPFYSAPDTTPAEKAVLVVLLNMASDITYDAKTITAIREIMEKQHANVNDFINALSANKKIIADPAQALFKKALTKRLSQIEYDEIISAYRIRILEEGTEDQIDETLEHISDEWGKLEKQQEPLIKAAQQLAYFKELSGPAFDAHIKTKPAAIHNEYSKLLQENTLILDQLQRNYNKLQGYLKSIPETSTDEAVQESREELKYKLARLGDQLAAQRSVQNKLIKGIQEIARVMSGREQYLYKGRGISFSLDSAAATSGVEGMSISDRAPPPPAKEAKARFEKEKLAAGEKCYTYHVTEKVGDVTTKGTFTQTFDPEEKAPALADKSGAVTKTPHFKITMTKAPETETKVAVPHAAQVAFYMDMALAAMVARGGNAPSASEPLYLRGGKPDEMALLWTAFMVLGEKFNFGPEAINVSTDGFDPSNERVSRIVYTAYASNSKYNTVFHSTEARVSVVLAEKLADADELIASAKKTNIEIKNTIETTLKYKKEIKDDSLKQAEKERNEEGAAVPDPEPSTLKYQN